ncbi:MAG: hypothetical protein KGR26_06780, partial [Cyanobacteria bacterium REEB65]|nr:hypothetical protein [Cyanobacteria bacterium REEB65]
MRRLLSPTVLVPTILSLAIFSLLIGMIGRQQLFSALALTPARAGIVLGLLVAYFLCKAFAWL